jgi:lysophospholipase L1-like esterase
VLHIGDSFAGALGIELNRRFKEHGVRGVLRYETSSYIPTWASDAKLSGYLAQYDPDLVLVTLGANELEVVDPTIRVRTIRKLVERLEGRTCVWVGVPLWDGARGALLDVIREHCAPCVYLDSNHLFPDMPRARDNIHPSMQAREEWAARVLDWLATHRAPTDAKLWAIEAP